MQINSLEYANVYLKYMNMQIICLKDDNWSINHNIGVL